ncbi:Nuclear pore complex protein [Armadillidium vulgare]|nr:Nuclear pore complex protein [Armadillidium vulgare]
MYGLASSLIKYLLFKGVRNTDSLSLMFIDKKDKEKVLQIENAESLQKKMPNSQLSSISRYSAHSKIPKSTLKLVSNPIFMTTCLATSFEIAIVAGFILFMPKYMENQFSISSIKASILTVIHIGEENTCANEFDIKKALDLLSWLEDPEEVKELRRLIWVRAITRNSWKHLDTDNPIESMSDTVFFRTVELAYTQGCDIKDLLTPAEDLLNSEELGDLIQDPTFQFLLKAGYEKIDEITA